MRPSETPAPETLPLTDDLRRWAADAVPGLSLDHERDKFLCYARAHGLTNVDWSEALKFWWLEAHARAVRRGTLQFPAAPGSAPAPEPPPVYDAELHAQMQADIARLCGPTGPSMPGTNDDQEPRRRRVSRSYGGGYGARTRPGLSGTDAGAQGDAAGPGDAVAGPGVMPRSGGSGGLGHGTGQPCA